jgi:hypothetical protein
LQFKIDNDINLSDLDLLGHSPNCQEQGVGFPAPFLLSCRALTARNPKTAKPRWSLARLDACAMARAMRIATRRIAQSA